MRHFRTPSLVGARGGGTPRAGETLGSEGDARLHEMSRLPDSGRTFEVGVGGRKGVRLEPTTLLWLRNRQVDIIVRD